MTRYDDMMQKMTIEEMVSLITQQPCRRCIWGNGDCNGKTRCASGVERWLTEEKDIKAQGGIHAHCGAKMDEQENGAEDENRKNDRN